LAAIAVVVHHFPPVDLPSDLVGLTGLGPMGVWLFFVLSGFLITGILVAARSEAGTSVERRLGVIRAFYARRFLRIFPLYYAVVIGIALCDPRIRKLLRWFLLYLANFFIASAGTWDQFPAGHFWSLAVEEQFYLTWPALVLFLPEALLVPVLTMVVAVGPISRFLLNEATHNQVTALYVTTSCLDPLAIGGVLAILRARGTGATNQRRLERALLVAGVVLLLLSYWLERVLVGRAVVDSLLLLSWSMIFAWLVGRAANGFRGPGRVILESRPITYVGAISYGVYVYHPFIPRLADLILRPLGFRSLAHPVLPSWTTFVLVVAATIAVASLSWFVFEKPINDLKRFFPYRQRSDKSHARRPQADALVANRALESYVTPQ
jgi:peptidoglycan/LPS O-acetylase OafA/YrhL